MRAALTEMLFGLIAAVVLVYLLLVVNFPILGRSLHHHYGLARRAGGHCSSIVRDPYEHLCAGADGRDHDDGRGDGQFDPARVLRPRADRRPWRRNTGRGGGREGLVSDRCS